MKKLFIIAVCLLSASALHAQNVLHSSWKFKVGDDTTWASPGYNDGDWHEIQAGVYWEQQGYPAYDGFGWYRQSVIISKKWKKAAAENGGFLLNLGRIDDSDYIYWNGELLAKTGELPPNYKTAYSELRSFTIPADKIRWGHPNLIAVRVYDGGGNGGIYGEPIELRVKGMQDLFSMEPQFRQANRIFLGNDPVTISIMLKNASTQRLDGALRMKVLTDFHEPVKEENLSCQIRRQSDKTITLELGRLEPGFYEVSVDFSSSDTNKQLRFKFGVNPEQIVSPLDRPGDFDDFWRRAKKELAAVEPQYRLIEQEDLSTAERTVYIVEMRSLGNVLVRGWFATPVKAGKYPAILHVQGYSTFLKLDGCYAGSDMVVFGLNIRGHGFSRDSVDPGFPGYLLHHVDDKELYIYRGAYMDCIRAVDFLCSRAEVDTTRICVEGGSQGGALSFATAALDHRIDLCVPHVPFLSDFRDYFRLVGWPGGEFANYVKAHPEVGWDQVYHTLSYVDIKNLAPWIKAPVIMTIGLMDETCPPHTNFAAYNQLEVPKEYHVYPLSGHGMPGDYYSKRFEWIKQRFGVK